ncbi:MAG TPA: HD-GYP domain-containing protein [Symbiobacteriaceae bacterium]|nr:HD-GYP domain-containing protein [Symbiobacteriaceae bacterium]
MLILPKPLGKSRPLLIAVTVTFVVGIAVAALIRAYLQLSQSVPLKMAAVILPLLILTWAWHMLKWPGVSWVEVAAYAGMVMTAQSVMEVPITGALFVIPVIGVLQRHTGLTLYSAALGVVAYGVILMTSPLMSSYSAPALALGAHAILQGTLAAIYCWLITLAGQAERTLVQAQMTQQMAQQWAASIEARDRYTGGHVERVTRYATELAPLVPGWQMDMELFHLACILHDVGKIAVPDQILNKPGALTAEEWLTMQQHPTNGSDLVLRTNAPPEVAAIVRHHHERWDGKGYPDGLKAQAIPLAARVLAVADAFDAMTSVRPYRPALSLREAGARIREGAGTQFDPAVVSAFEEVHLRWAELYRQDSTVLAAQDVG